MKDIFVSTIDIRYQSYQIETLLHVAIAAALLLIFGALYFLIETHLF